MVRTHHHNQEEEEEDEDDYISRTTDGSSQKDGRSNDQKATSHRSKHSETEQRRRSKINERFQILRDLIPENDQKRDRASFLLEVIQYIQFLQEKLQVYEGTYQGWRPEPTKLMPWSGIDQSDSLKNGSIEDNNTSALFTNAHNLVHQNENTFEPETSHMSNVDLLTSQSRPQNWNSTPSDLEESSISNAYSKGMLNNLTQALGSSGVDLSQASISVQFDIRKGSNSGATSTSFGIKDDDLLSFGNGATTHCDQAYKRRRTE